MSTKEFNTLCERLRLIERTFNKRIDELNQEIILMKSKKLSVCCECCGGKVEDSKNNETK